MQPQQAAEKSEIQSSDQSTKRNEKTESREKSISGNLIQDEVYILSSGNFIR